MDRLYRFYEKGTFLYFSLKITEPDRFFTQQGKGKGKGREREEQLEMNAVNDSVNPEDDDDFDFIPGVQSPDDDHKIIPMGHGRFTSVVECFLAIYHLKEDGNMGMPEHCTQALARFAYFSKGLTLVEGNAIGRSNPTWGLYKYAFFRGSNIRG